MRRGIWWLCFVFCVSPGAHADPQIIEGCDRDAAALLASQPLSFEPGTAAILGESRSTLDTLAELAVLCSQASIFIEGHTDSMGSDSVNLALSQQRANAVGRILRERGVSADRISSEGFGASRPIADNATRSGRKLNRRVVVRFVSRSAP